MRTTVMEGSLADFDLASVIQVVSIGRQYTGVELFDESGNVVGTLFLKSGKILAASSGSASGLDAVTSLFRDNRQKRFSVYRTEPFADVKSPVGSVGEILLKLMEGGAPESAERIPVMEGSLTEFDLLSVLQVISIGRQFTAVDLNDLRGRPIGRIEVKAGKVISATADHLNGFDAIRHLAHSPRESRFVVYRSRAAVAEHHLGPLAQILLKLADPDDQWEPAEGGAPPPRSRPGAENNGGVGASTRSMSPPPPSASPPRLTRPSARPPTPSPPPPPAPTRPKMDSKVDRGSGAEQRPMPPPAATASLLDTQSPRHTAAMPAAGRDVPIICLTSPKGGAGKTTVALNLGVALARQGKRVALIDADGNGVLLALNALNRSGSGAHDVMAGRARLDQVEIKTRVPGLRIVPSGDPSSAIATTTQSWGQLFSQASAGTDVILVDTAAGLYGPSGDVCAASTHALVVLSAEPAGLRALPLHLERLGALGKSPPQLVGIVLNMLDYRARVSLDVLRDLCGGAAAPWVFDIPIARSQAFMEAVARGVPVCRSDRVSTPTIGWVFEMLASGILERLGILTPAYDDALLI